MAQIMLKVGHDRSRAAFLLAGAGSLALIARELRKAPEGYEDDHGFHTVHQDTGGQVKTKIGR
jgi:hypothetical protein